MTTLIARDAGAPRARVPGLINLRGNAAWQTHDGQLAAGRLYRSESPAQLTEAGTAALTALGIDLIVDLRSVIEADAAPYRHDGMRRRALPIPLLAPDDAARLQTITLEGLYERLVDDFGTTLVAAIQAIARHDGGAVLVHCTAGKDRTGVVVALVLLLLGVDRTVVLEDYASTNPNLAGEWTDAFLQRVGLESPPDNILTVINGSPAEVLDRLIDRLEATHGGVEQYLRTHGLDDHDVARLRIRLTAPNSTRQDVS